ncbi:Cupin superfamily protein [Nesidiocoris tenuis]|uniref:Cupin superfamily protein n=1 Tax=Nesidiocoris tenuis TaxID=355587 RepID=A0ABN7A6X2_9HEMI|nr:Cupin superfamily protein [Nesidiocoris tenuis]
MDEISKLIDDLIQEEKTSHECLQLLQEGDEDVRHLLLFGRQAIRQHTTTESVESALNAAIDMSWEDCNVGHWSQVPEPPKSLYAYGSFLKALLCLMKSVKNPGKRVQYLETAVKSADLGLMLGKGVQKLLSRMATAITAALEREKPEFQSTPSDQEMFEKLNIVPIERRHCPSVHEFDENHFQTGSPVILLGCMDHWPAMVKWRNLDYLVKIAGPRTVPVEIGSSYTHNDWGMKLTSIEDFIKKHIMQKSPKTGYLAQHQLFDQIPELRKDICIPDYCCLSNDESCDGEVDINAWFGPANTLTPLHHDPKYNLLCQVIGKKRVLLYSPDDSEYLHPHMETVLNNTAQVDPLNPDYEKFPTFKKAVTHYCQLGPGEILFIPPKWWHHVESLDVSFSVSFWWK